MGRDGERLRGNGNSADVRRPLRVKSTGAAAMTPLWGDQFDKGLLIFDLQRLCKESQTRSDQNYERGTIARDRRYTADVAARIIFTGRSKLLRYTKDDTLAAVKAFEDALRLDGNYALAHAGLAEASAQMRIRFSPEAEVKLWEERAKQAANRALELDPELAEAHEALASVYRNSEFNWEQTIEERIGAENEPNWISALYRAEAFFIGLLDG